MTEDEKLKFFLSEKLFKLILDKKTPFEEKKEQIDYLIRLGADVNTNVYGKNLASWAKVLGNEEIVKYIKENGGVENQISKEDAEILGKQFWDDDGRIKSIDEIKELVLMGADLSVKNHNDEQIWKFLSFEEMNEVLKDLPKGYVIEGDVRLNVFGLTQLPDFSKIKVKGYFDCSYNQLINLKGAPREVGGEFWCRKNQLTSLEGTPSEVGGDFDCSWNQLTDLKGAPSEIREGFNCSNNQLTTLQGAPSKVGGDFYCEENLLTTLQGAPEKVGENFGCNNNELTTLKGAPSEVGGSFDCSDNQLTDLKGAPEKVGGSFWCSSNKLTTLNGAPNKVGRSFICNGNQLKDLKGDPMWLEEVLIVVEIN